MELHPGFTVVEGHYQMTKEWSIALPSRFNKRIEDGNLVFWQPGVTAWVCIWDNDESKEQKLASIKEQQSPEATSDEQFMRGETLYYTYRLLEQAEDKQVSSLCCYAISETSYVQMAVYFNKESDFSSAKALCLGISNNPKL